MRLRRLDIRGFGRLRGSIPLDAGRGRLGLVVERNEAGKSTLATAILAALYGLDNDRRRIRTGPTPLDAHRPWEGTSYGLRLHLEHDGEDLVVERDFTDDTVRVVSGSADITDRFRDGSRVEVGRHLTGLTRHQFRLSFFVGQGTLVWGDASSLGEALQRAADSQSGQTTAARALAALDAGLRNYRGETLNGGMVDTEIQRCQEALARDRAQLEGLEAERTALGQSLHALERGDAERQAREARRAELRARHARTRAFELTQSIRRQEELAREIAHLEEQIRGNPDVVDLDEDTIAAWEARLREREAQRDRVESARADVRDAEAAVARAVSRRKELGLHRRPTEDDLTQLVRAVDRLESSAEEREDLERDLQESHAGLAARGIEPEVGLELAERFEGLEEADRELLVTHRLVGAKQADRLAAVRTRIDERKRERARIRHAQQSSKHFGIWCLIMAMLPMLVGISMHAILPFDPWFLYGPSVAGLVLGIAVFSFGSRWRRPEDERLKGEVRDLRSEERDLAESVTQADGRWTLLSERLGLPANRLADAYEQFRMAEVPLRALRTKARRRDELDAIDARAMAEVAELWTLLGEQPDPAQLRPQVERVREGLAAARQVDEANASVADRQRRVEEASQRLATLETQLASDLGTLGLPSTPSTLDQALPRLRARFAAARRHREQRDHALPGLRAQAWDAETWEARRAALREWEQEVEGLGEHPEAQEPLGRQEYDAVLRELEAEEEEARARDLDRRTEARSFLARFEQEAPRLRESIQRHQTALRRATGFAEAVRLAHGTLAGIARDTHRDWATALNGTVREHLRALASDVTDLHFAEDLTVRVEQHGQLLTAAEAARQLSVGALDGVYLAARLAVADYLHADLPLVLDDPFANADDRRLVAGLRMLADHVAPRRQVLLLACQASRYRWALDQLGRPDAVTLLTLADQRASTG